MQHLFDKKKSKNPDKKIIKKIENNWKFVKTQHSNFVANVAKFFGILILETFDVCLQKKSIFEFLTQFQKM